ncbi:hypothetical protein BACCIP111895_04832 [Neobacillus rhizosphaerae]|uniref:Group-specific protein n=1 Tax=Neobacillus rhizosphaerae TaxID=2880965 RepID=A0ABN8KUU0_9BACI|nr:hypothetical protein [Neobacillus rhizosphaerae]CAH2717616.1 hypothetical protein BACCIP111895_04832 [Neobacillus rhizosphaerae]
MIKKVLISFCIFILYTTHAMAQTNHQIQIIDIKKGKVIKNVQKNPDLQQEVEKFLEGITGVYVKLNPYPNNGFVIKIPLEPNVTVENQWFNDLLDEVMIIFPVQENPYLLVFDNENQPYFFKFQGNTSKFLGLLNFKP